MDPPKAGGGVSFGAAQWLTGRARGSRGAVRQGAGGSIATGYLGKFNLTRTRLERRGDLRRWLADRLR